MGRVSPIEAVSCFLLFVVVIAAVTWRAHTSAIGAPPVPAQRATLETDVDRHDWELFFEHWVDKGLSVEEAAARADAEWREVDGRAVKVPELAADHGAGG